MAFSLPDGWTRCEVHNVNWYGQGACNVCSCPDGKAPATKSISMVFYEQTLAQQLADREIAARRASPEQSLTELVYDEWFPNWRKSPDYAYQADDVDELSDIDEKPIGCGWPCNEACGHLAVQPAHVADPMERMVDGLTVRECLARMERSAQPHPWDSDSEQGGLWHWLTAAQQEAARLAWSSSLRAKQAEVKEMDRLSVRCDEQWGEDV